MEQPAGERNILGVIAKAGMEAERREKWLGDFLQEHRD